VTVTPSAKYKQATGFVENCHISYRLNSAPRSRVAHWEIHSGADSHPRLILITFTSGNFCCSVLNSVKGWYIQLNYKTATDMVLRHLSAVFTSLCQGTACRLRQTFGIWVTTALLLQLCRCAL